MQQWTVLQKNAVNLTIADSDNDTVVMYPLQQLPMNSSFIRIGESNVWQFSWIPQNMDNIQLTYDISTCV